MTKLSIRLMIICMALALLAACSNQSTSSTKGTASPAKEDKKVNLVWSGWSGEEEASKPIIESMIKTWNDKNPNTTVKWVGWPFANALQQLILRFQGKENLDVAQVDIGWLKTLASADALVDLSTVFDSKFLKDNIDEASLKVGQIDGKQVGVPWTLASIGMVYNPTLLDKAGVTAPPKTIAEFEDALKKLKDSNPNLIPYAMETKTPGSIVSDFNAWVWTFGGSFFDDKGNVTINSDQVVQALNWYKSLLDKGYIKMDVSRTDARQLYAKNLIGFYDDAILAKGILEATGVAKTDSLKSIKPMLRPVQKSGDVPQSVSWGHALVIFKNSENKDRAAEFIKHLISEEQSISYFEKTSMLPVKKEALSDPKVKNDEWANKWSDVSKTMRNGEVKLLKEVNELSTIIAEEVQAALSKTKTAKQAMDDAAAKMKTLLKK